MSQPKECVARIPFCSGTPMGQVMFMAMGNSGTDWFMDAYHHFTKCGVYYREFFDPSSNPERQEELSKAFGCERHIENIVRPWEELPTLKAYERTWRRVMFDVTKETWMSFKVGFFEPRFDCCVLTRSMEGSLPPSRPNLGNAVLAGYEALVLGRRWLSPELKEMLDVSKEYGDGRMARMVTAWCVMWRKLLEDAEKFSIPVVRYEALMSEDLGTVEKELSVVPAITSPANMARYVAQTRRCFPRSFEDMDAMRLLERMAGMMGERIAGMVAPTVAGKKI